LQAASSKREEGAACRCFMPVAAGKKQGDENFLKKGL
jgi:hypothetical protein